MSTIGSFSLPIGAGTGPAPDPGPCPPLADVEIWERPEDWIYIDNMIAEDSNEVVALFAVYPPIGGDWLGQDKGKPNAVTVYCETFHSSAVESYIVDWGDGSTPETVLSGVLAKHIYDYDDLALHTTTSEGFRQAVIKIQGTGDQPITKIDLTQRNPDISITYGSQFLDIKICGVGLTEIKLGTNTTAFNFDILPVGAKIIKVHQTAAVPVNLMFWGSSVILCTVSANTGTSSHSMFRSCYYLQHCDLTDLTSGTLTTMADMFRECHNLITLIMPAPENLDTSGSPSLSYMFGDCRSIELLDLLWLAPDPTAGTISISAMFSGCYSLKNILNFSNVKREYISLSLTFGDCRSLQHIDLTDLGDTFIAGWGQAFLNCYSLISVNLGTVRGSRPASGSDQFYRTFYNCFALQVIKWPTGFDTSLFNSFAEMFYACSSLKTMKLPNWDTSNVTNFTGMFRLCSSLRELDLSLLDVSGVTTNNLEYMFHSCTNLQKLNLANWNPVGATSLGYTFYNCFSLLYVDLRDWNPTNFTRLFQSFRNCYALQELRLDNLDLSSLNSVSWDFAYSRNLQVADFSHTTWGVSSQYAFFGTANLTKLRLPGWEATFVISNNKLEAVALNELFGDLADRTALASLTITITGNPGADDPACDRTIATAKNWSVIG